MTLDESPFGTAKYKGLFQGGKNSAEVRMETNRDNRPIYSLSSFPVLEGHGGDRDNPKGQRPNSQLNREERLGGSQALERSSRGKTENSTAKMLRLEDELKVSNPELFTSLQDVKRTLQGHSMKRFQQFEALGMMNTEENSVRATAALRVDLIRRTVGLGIKAEKEDHKLNKNEETTLEVQLDAVLNAKGLKDLEAITQQLSESQSESQYEKHKKLKRAMQNTKTLEIQREAEAVSKALSRALAKYRGAIKETLQEPKSKRLPARSLGLSLEEDKSVYEKVITSSPDERTREEKQQVMMHSANDNLDKANDILERLKLYTETISANDEENAPGKEGEGTTTTSSTAAGTGDDHSSSSTVEEEKGSDKGKEDEASVVPPQEEGSRGPNTKEKSSKSSEPSTNGAPKARQRTQRKSVIQMRKTEQEYEEALARARAEAKEMENEKKFQAALVLDPIENSEVGRDASDVVQERFERIWRILDMPLMERMDMVIKYTSEEGLNRLEAALNQYEKCAGGLRLYHFLTSSPDSTASDILTYRDLEMQDEYPDRCKQYIQEQAYVLLESLGDYLTFRGEPLKMH